MQNLDVSSIIGQPLESPSVQAVIAHYQLEDSHKDIPPIVDYEGNVTPIPWAKFMRLDDNDEYSAPIIINCSIKKYGAPMLVQSVRLLSNFDCCWPYGLNKNTDFKTVNIGQKIEFSKNPYGGFDKVFLVNNCEVSCHFDEDYALDNLIINEIEQNTLNLTAFKDRLASQKKQLLPQFTISHLPNPVYAWRNRMNGVGIDSPDKLFTEQRLTESQQILDDYLQNLQTAAAAKKPAAIYKAAEVVTKAFNKLNIKNQHFIETSEREELVPYILNIAKAAGLQFDDGLDLTETWREW